MRSIIYSAKKVAPLIRGQLKLGVIFDQLFGWRMRKKPSDVVHFGIHSQFESAHYYTACGFSYHRRWTSFAKKEVTCKVCLKAKKETIQKRINFLQVETIMES